MTDSTRPALFLDRDGTLIADVPYLADPTRVQLLPGAAELVQAANRIGWPVVIVTNQSGIARGLISEAQYHAVADRVVALLAANGGHVTATYYCPHEPSITGSCPCRKPAIGMYRSAAKDHGLTLAESVYVGDRWRDVAAAAATGGIGLFMAGVETTAEDHRLLDEAAAGGARVHRVTDLVAARRFLPDGAAARA